jgi:hypothetical protein
MMVVVWNGFHFPYPAWYGVGEVELAQTDTVSLTRHLTILLLDKACPKESVSVNLGDPSAEPR